MQIKKNNCIDYYIFIKKQHFTSFSAEEYHIERHTRHHHCTNWISVSIGEMMRALLIAILFLYAAFCAHTKPNLLYLPWLSQCLVRNILNFWTSHPPSQNIITIGGDKQHRFARTCCTGAEPGCWCRGACSGSPSG